MRTTLKSSTITDRRRRADKRKADFPPIHPGEILREEFLEPMGITPYRLAKDIKVPQTRIAAILAGERSVTPDTALRLSRYLGMSGVSGRRCRRTTISKSRATSSGSASRRR
jgi:addiction module HigA family antidote